LPPGLRLVVTGIRRFTGPDSPGRDRWPRYGTVRIPAYRSAGPVCAVQRAGPDRGARLDLLEVRQL